MFIYINKIYLEHLCLDEYIKNENKLVKNLISF